MKICMMSCMLGCQTPAAEVLKIAQYCRTEAVDWVTSHGATPAELKKLSADAGMPIAAYTPLKGKVVNGLEKGYEDETRESVDEALEAGAPVLMIPPFPIKGKSMSEALKIWTEVYAIAVEHAKGSPLHVTLESTGMSQSPLVTGEEVMSVLKQVPGLKVTFDQGNTATACDEKEAYKMVKDYIVHFHLKDWIIRDAPFQPDGDLKRNGKYFGNVIIGQGDMDVKGFWDLVTPEQKATCYVNMETLDFTRKKSPAESLKEVADMLRNW